MTKRTRIFVIAITGLLIIGMAFFPMIKKSLKKEDKKPVPKGQAGGQRNPLAVNGLVLQYSTLNDIFRTKGILLPDEEVDLSFETSGKITNINFTEGSYVTQGQMLAKINDKPLQAELKKLETQLPLANERVFRQKTLLEKDAVSQETYEVVVTELEKLKADIELVKTRIAQTELRAPFSGIIGLRQVSNGAYASPSVVISKLTKISPLKVEFSVNERQVDEIRPGTRLNFGIENDKNVYEAVVYAVESQLDAQTLSLKARARYPNPGGRLKAGQSATVEIRLRQITNTVVIPSIASIAEMGRDIAYIYKDGKAKQVVLTKGLRTENSVQVVSGISVGDTLLTTGVMQLRDGMTVKLGEVVTQAAP